MIFDAHCDALMKLWMDRSLSFQNGQHLHVTFPALAEAKVKVQCFAIYIPENVPEEARFTVALEMIDIFFERIINRFPLIKFIRSKRDIDALEKMKLARC